MRTHGGAGWTESCMEATITPTCPVPTRPAGPGAPPHLPGRPRPGGLPAGGSDRGAFEALVLPHGIGERVEDGLLAGIGRGGALGVPLDGQHPTTAVGLERLDDPVGAPAGDDETRGD